MHLGSIKLRLSIFCVSVLAGIFAILVKGPNLDEFWTVTFSDPRLDWATAWLWWSSDTGHPPGYYALVRLWLDVFPISVTSVRFLNLLPWIALAYYWLFSAGNREIRSFCAIFFLCASATFFNLERLAEARAYSIAFVLVCLLATELRGLETGAGQKGRLGRIIAASACLAALDYPVFLAAAGLLTVAAAALFLASRPKDAAWILGGVAAGGAVLLASLVNSMGHEHIPPPYYSSTMAYLRSALVAVVVALAGNVVVSALAARGMLEGLGRGYLRDRKYRDYSFKHTIVLSSVLMLAGFLALNLVLHGIITRHLIPVTAVVCASLAAWFPEGLRSRPAAWLTLLAFALSTAVVLHRLAGMDNLHRFAERLAAEQRGCKSFKIIPVDMFELGGSSDSVLWQTRAHASRFGQSEIARKFGFSLAAPQDRAIDPRCGGAVWFVPAYPALGATAASLLEVLRVPVNEAQRSGARMFNENTVLVVQVPGTSGGDRPQESPPVR